jgi:enoyl-CoA hydratase/carnithine racemase
MADELVLKERRGRIGLIRLNRPEKLNAMSTAMLHRFIEIMAEHEADPEVHAIVMAGEGRSFSAGRDLGDVQSFHGQGSDSVRAGMAPLIGLFGSIRESNKVTVVVAQGHCLGFGCAIAALADITVAEETAKFGMTEARRGLATLGPLPGLVRALPHKVLMEMVMSGDSLDAERAHQIGFANRVTPAGKGLEVTLAWLESFLENDGGYVRDTKEAIRMIRSLPDADAMEYLVEKSLLHHTAGKAQHGVDAFVKA